MRTVNGAIAFVAPVLPVLPVLFTSAAYSCPVCHTQTGEQVRAGIFKPKVRMEPIGNGVAVSLLDVLEDFHKHCPWCNSSGVCQMCQGTPVGKEECKEKTGVET